MLQVVRINVGHGMLVSTLGVSAVGGWVSDGSSAGAFIGTMVGVVVSQGGGVVLAVGGYWDD